MIARPSHAIEHLDQTQENQPHTTTGYRRPEVTHLGDLDKIQGYYIATRWDGPSPWMRYAG